MKTGPPPNAGTADELAKARRVVAELGLTGAANDTKWSILLDAMRTREGWVPSYRYGTIGGYVSRWDVEWWYHLPFPMLCVEWFDIGLSQEIRRGRLLDPEIVDHSGWVLALLDSAKFDYEVFEDVVRIFGYLPRNRTQLESKG